MTALPDTRSPGLAELLEELESTPHVYSEAEALRDLLRTAARRPTAVKVGRVQVLLERGELVASQPALAARWGWSRSCARRFLEQLVARGVLLQTPLGARVQASGTKLTLVGFDTYATRAPKRAKAADNGKSKGDREIGRVVHPSDGQTVPPTPPFAVKPPLAVERSRPQGGAGGGVASARDVEKRTAASAQLELAGAENPEHLRFAEELAATLNRAQAENGRIDRETYRPVEAWHRGTLAAALAIRNAGVPLAYATQYVWLEGQRFKPSAKAAQIASLAYLERGLIAAYRDLERRQRIRSAPSSAPTIVPVPAAERARIREPIAVGDVLAGVLAQVRP